MRSEESMRRWLQFPTFSLGKKGGGGGMQIAAKDFRLFFVSRIQKSKLLAIQSEKKGAGGKECQIAAKATFT